MGLLDTLGLSGLQQKAQEFSTSPLGMASLGLLLQPRRRRIGDSGFRYALEGMQTAAANRQNQLLEERMKEADAMRQQEYQLRALQYGQQMQERAAQQAEMERRAQNFEKYVATRPPEEQMMLQAIGPESVKMMFEAQNQRPSAVSGALGRYQAAQNDPNNPFTGTLQQWMEYEASLRPEPSPHIQFIPTAKGLVAGNTRTGIPTMVMPGVLPAAVSPEIIGKGAEARAAGTVTGTSAAQSAISFPEAQAKAQYTLNLVDELVSHPGLSGAVGAPGAGKVAARIPGTKEAGFMSLLNQIQGRQFLEAFESLKGGGQITQIEGDKATQAISRMNTAQSEAEFKAAANEFQSIVSNAMRRSQAKAGGNATMTPGGMPVNTDMQGGRVMNFNDLPE